MRLVALDPGGITGAALHTRDGFQTFAQVAPEQVWIMLDNWKPEVVVMESFLFRQRTKVDLTPVEVIGRVKEWCRQHDIDLVMQTPAQAKHFWTDEKLKERGVYNKGLPHANDAARHALYFLEFGAGKK